MTSITGPGRERTKIVIVPGPPGPHADALGAPPGGGTTPTPPVSLSVRGRHT